MSAKQLRVPPGMSDFILGYPKLRPSPHNSDLVNLAFYQNRGPASPSPWKIDELHKNLMGNYAELEGRHDFIQWVFPIREKGVNWQSQPLELAEIEPIKADPAAMARLTTSYKMMLDFYGMRLIDPTTGQIGRSETPAPVNASWKRRYSNVLQNSHNYLRITRILKSHSELGREHLNAPWLLFFLLEQETHSELASRYLISSMDGYWRYCIRDHAERNWVVDKIDAVRGGEKWTEEDYVGALERRARTGTFAEEEAPAKEDDSSA